MFIKSFNLSVFKGRKLCYIIITGITVACILIATTFYIVNKDSKGFGLENILSKDNILYISSYYADYSVTVDSNKNTNNYTIKEWYSKDLNTGKEKFKFETSTQNGEKITYTMDENQVKIKSDNQLNEFYLSDYMIEKKNVMSLSTFFEIYLKIKDSNIDNCCNIENVVEDKKISYKINFGNNDCEISKEYADLLRDGVEISSIELLVDKETSKPTELFVYDKNNKVYIDISYNNFEINADFE